MQCIQDHFHRCGRDLSRYSSYKPDNYGKTRGLHRNSEERKKANYDFKVANTVDKQYKWEMVVQMYPKHKDMAG